MTRNIVLFLAVAGILAAAYFGVMSLLYEPQTGIDGNSAPPGLPESVHIPPAERLAVSPGIEVAPGGPMELTRYDERTGKPRDRLRFATWEPVGNDSNEVYVREPELAVRMPNGMIAAIRAVEGRIHVEKLQEMRSTPRRGWLRGNVQLTIDRAESFDQPATQPSDSRISVSMERLDFDLEVGKLVCDGALRAESAEFEVSGRGLSMQWNQGANELTQLSLRHGEQISLLGGGDIFGTLRGEPRPDTSAGAPRELSESASPRTPGLPPPMPPPGRGPTTYRIVLTGDVVAQQLVGDRAVGELTADEIRLMLDVGGREKGGQASAGSPASRPVPATQPTSGAATEPAGAADRGRIVIHWSGPLTMQPAVDVPPPVGKPRRRFEAIGKLVTLRQKDAAVRCGRLEVWDERSQIWVYPAEDGLVRIQRGDGLTAHAQSIYIDQNHNVVKLVGEVRMHTRGERGARGTSIHCTQWAEIALAPREEKGAEEALSPAEGALMGASQAATPVDLARIRGARFVGDVRVDLRGDLLTAPRLDVTFRADGSGDGLENLLETATATGDVRFTAGTQRLRCGRLALRFSLGPDGRSFPESIDARGDVWLRRDRSTLRGNRVQAQFVAGSENAEPMLRSLDVFENASLSDPGNAVVARGREIRADFVGANELTTASITGEPRTFATVRAEDYRVSGERIEIDRRAQALSVNGPSRLSFRSTRSLQGVRRGRDTRIEVAAARSLRVDLQNDRIEFGGNVIARGADEKLESDHLTLHLRRLTAVHAPVAHRGLTTPSVTLVTQLRRAWSMPPNPAVGAAGAPAWPADGTGQVAYVLAEGRRMLGLGAPVRTASEPLETSPADESENVRREPLRLVADNTLFTSETRAAGRSEPITQAEILAPLIEAEIPQRRIVTRGQTVLLMTNRGGSRDEPRPAATTPNAAPPAAQPAGDMVGLPSALVTRGPSQTAMQCEQSMTYILGEENTGIRRDAVVFDGRVRFRHRAERDAMTVDQAFAPDAKPAPPARETGMDCDRLECEFIADATSEQRGPGGRSMRLGWMIATGNVYLRDEEPPVIRTVSCTRLEFDRERGLVNVRGVPGSPANVYLENTQSSVVSRPMTGEAITIDLINNQIRSDKAQGEFRR